MIKLNPQIRSINIQGSSMEFLLVLRNLLPNLEHLVVSGPMKMQLQNTEDDIHFEHVKTLTFEGFEFFPQNFIFDRLQELYIGDAKDKFPFIRKHPTLKKLRIRGSLSDGELSMLGERIPSVTDASISCHLDVKSKTFIEFLDSNHQLKQLKLGFDRDHEITESNWNEIKLRIESQWNIVERASGTNFIDYLIERKNEPAPNFS